jgi:hypothetical protein
MQQNGNNGELLVAKIMKNIFQSLNGWQRLFVVLTIAIQLPLTILIGSEQTYTNPSAKFLSDKFQDIAVGEKITQSIAIYDEVSLNVKSGDDNLKELYKESERRGLGKLVGFSASKYFSQAYYVFLDNRMQEEEQLKVGNLVQKLIDEEFFKSQLKNYLATFVYSTFFSIAIYVLGMSIGWVIKGFRKT